MKDTKKNEEEKNLEADFSVAEKKTKAKEMQEKFAEKWEENKIRVYFVHLFGKYDIRNEAQFVKFCKWLIFSCVLLVEFLILVGGLRDAFELGKWWKFTLTLAVVLLLSVSEGMKLFVAKGKARIIFYVLDAVSVCSFMFLTNSTLSFMIYLLILTEFYIGAEKISSLVVLLVASIFLYVTSYALKVWVLSGIELSYVEAIIQSLGILVALGIHFVVVQVAVAFYHQFLKLDKALMELDESQTALKKAYAMVAEVTALEERQRIAKEIHDTAGHSLTTVIMQTEAAKRVIDKDREEAKSKIIAANLQAKHALEELRDSVHLLSGTESNRTLKTEMEEIIHESTDGTGIVIRSEIAETYVSPAKHRFLCNTLKEGISNGLRHGGATAFWFELKVVEEEIHFLLSDNGVGTPMDALQKGFGLKAMENRANALGGEITFSSEQGEGFEIHLRLKREKEEN